MGPGFCPQLGGVGPCPAQCIWQGSGFAADQTNAMLAVGGTSCISLISVAAADENSLTPLHRLLPTETASLGFGGSPVGGGDKSSRFAFFRHFYVRGVVSLPSACASCRRNAGRPQVTAAYLPFLCRTGARPVRAEDLLVGYTRHPVSKPRTQRLTRRNTGHFHCLRHRQGR